MWAVSIRLPSSTRNSRACFLPELAVAPRDDVDGRPVLPMGKGRMGLLVICQGLSSKDRKEMESSPM